MEYLCSACGQKVGRDMMVYMDHTEKHVIDLVKHDHPEWVEEDGLCQKCVDYYKAELKGSFFGDAPCAIRRRKTNAIIDSILNVFRRKKE